MEMKKQAERSPSIKWLSERIKDMDVLLTKDKENIKNLRQNLKSILDGKITLQPVGQNGGQKIKALVNVDCGNHLHLPATGFSGTGNRTPV